MWIVQWLMMSYGGKKGREPWANTVAYYPLTSTTTVNDMSGNNRNLTNNNVVFGTYQWVNCWYFNARWSSTWYCWLYNSSFYPWGSASFPITVNLWFLASWNSTYHNPRLIWPILWAKEPNKVVAWWYNGWDIDWLMFNIWERTNAIFVLIDNNHYTVYKNWVLQYENVYTDISVWNSKYLVVWTREDNWTGYWDKWDWWISNLILENKVRTADEVSAYYNQTKWNYWL